MSAIQPLWAKSNVAGIVERIGALIGAKLPNGLRVRVALGPAEDARNAAPPSICFIDGDNTTARYEERGGEGHPDGHVIRWRFVEHVAIVRGVDVRMAELLEQALLAAIDEEFSPNGSPLQPSGGRRRGGNQSEHGFQIEIPIEFKTPVLREEFQTVTIAEWQATGQLTDAAGENPETIIEQETG